MSGHPNDHNFLGIGDSEDEQRLLRDTARLERRNQMLMQHSVEGIHKDGMLLNAEAGFAEC